MTSRSRYCRTRRCREDRILTAPGSDLCQECLDAAAEDARDAERDYRREERFFASLGEDCRPDECDHGWDY